jgi:hypothetical protein
MNVTIEIHNLQNEAEAFKTYNDKNGTETI